MLRRTALVAAAATIGIAACVSNEKVDPNVKASTDAGADAATASSTSSSGGSSGTVVSNGPNLCGDIQQNSSPSCPGVGAHDNSCTDDLKTACCPGVDCVKSGDSCGKSKPFECFAGEQCNDGASVFQGRCCVTGKLDDDAKRNGCNIQKRLTVPDTENTRCAQECSGGSFQICRLGDDRDTCPTGTSCLETVISIVNPQGIEPFLRKVGVCR